MTSFAVLRDLARRPEPSVPTKTSAQTRLEKCDLCGVGLQERHRHLIDPVSRRLTCACDACAARFLSRGETKYKSVPRDARLLPDFVLSDAQWEGLLIPIGLAFFFRSSVEGSIVALYPSPAGSTESSLPMDAWQQIVADNPSLAVMEPDVEALLVNRLTDPAEYYLAPIDKCYELTGLIRTNWHGLFGGGEMWEKIREFFVDLKANARA